MANNEVSKLQQHLSLLKQEYSKLQTKYRDLESKYTYIAATNGERSDNFASRLVNAISNLYNSETYSDIKIKLADREMPAHRLVLTARSNLWDENFLNNKKLLDWTKIDPDVAHSLVQWIYKSDVTLVSDDLATRLIKQAFEFKLNGLVECCEQYLISVVNIRSCVKFYSVAEEINGENLRDYCSGLISAHWDDLNSSDFEHMSGPLLHKMLKSKTQQWALHAAVRLQREDVVFLCLVEDNAASTVNAWSPSGELPLDAALAAGSIATATTLMRHGGADPNTRDSTGDALLHRALRRRDAMAASFLLENGCDAGATTRGENDSAMHLLAGAGDLENCEELAGVLIDKHVDINAQNRLGFTPLHVAIQADKKSIFNLLLAQDHINVNIKNGDEHTPLYFALLKYESGDDEEDSYAEILIQKGAQTNPLYKETCNNLLQVLILNGAQKAAVFLATKVQNLNHVNLEGETALHLACQKNYSELVKKLVDLGANPNLLTNELRRSALHYAVKYNSNEAIQALIEHNIDIEAKTSAEKEVSIAANFNLRDVEGDTPISLALNEGNNLLVPILIKGGADVNVRDGKDFSLLHRAILKEDAKTALFLLENGVDINAKTADSEIPLQLAIYCRLPEVVDALCTRGVDMSVQDGSGNCPLWAALESGQEEIASILVRHGADTDCWSKGPDGCRQTLLHRAMDENKEAAAIFLIQAGCDLDSPRMPGPNGEGGEESKDGAAPLHLCCEWGLEAVVRTLVEHRANVNARDAVGKTPLHYAIEYQHDPIVSLLLSVPEIDLSLRDKSGLSPFAAALTFRNHKAAQTILDKMPNAAEQFDSKGQNFLHVALRRGDIESALFLLTVYADVNSRVQDVTMATPLHLAARHADETLVRSLILAGARVDDRDAHKRTALHIAAEAGNAPAVSALLQNNASYDAVDVESDNALHIAVREGHLNVVRSLLTESSIDAEAVNLKGRNPLHELCKYGKENAATICELFLECMPDYPINNLDVNGNSPLLLAYMKGNSSLCKVLVKANACLASENCDRVTIFNYQVPSKQLLTRLLDQLSQPATWTTTDSCQECGKGFSITVRTHHCRHCGRALCSKCSDQEVPIVKFNEAKAVRVCRVCFDVLKTGAS